MMDFDKDNMMDDYLRTIFLTFWLGSLLVLIKIKYNNICLRLIGSGGPSVTGQSEGPMDTIASKYKL